MIQMEADKFKAEMSRAYAKGATDVIDSLGEALELLRRVGDALTGNEVIDGVRAGLDSTRRQMEEALP